MREETFANYRNFRWLWISLVAMAAMTVFYFMDHPVGGRNGGTVLGYTYGILSAIGIAWLMWYGIRKRYSYHAAHSTLKGWLGAHVWIGVSLAYIVLLHSGFSLGLNLHTLAYALMVITIVSGIWGAMAFAKLPQQMKARRDGLTPKASLDQLDIMANDMSSLARGKTETFQRLLNALDFQFNPSAAKSLFSKPIAEPTKQELSVHLAKLSTAEYDDGLKLVSLAHRRAQLANQLIDETRTGAWLKLWLYFHAPIAFGCLVAVVLHIVVVFFYW